MGRGPDLMVALSGDFWAFAARTIYAPRRAFHSLQVPFQFPSWLTLSMRLKGSRNHPQQCESSSCVVGGSDSLQSH